MSTEKFGVEIENCIRRNTLWNDLPTHLHKILHYNKHDYEKYVFNYSLKNQLRFRGNIVSKVFRNEQRYYELLIQKNVYSLGLFPYHLADVVTRGLRVTPFNYYLDVISQLLLNDKSYDTLPNFTAADCLRVLGIGRNEYLSLISEMKTRSMRLLLFNTKPNPLDILPKFPANNINIEPWWYVEIGYVLESDIRYVNVDERNLLDYLIDYGPIEAGKCNYMIIQSLYRKGFVYLDVAIAGKERISIPPLRNFVMNRINGDYFENLLYKIFISVDEHMTVHELSQMLQVDFDIVKQAVALFCRLGFAQLKEKYNDKSIHEYHNSWSDIIKKRMQAQPIMLPITPLTYNKNQLLDDNNISAELIMTNNNNNINNNYIKNNNTAVNLVEKSHEQQQQQTTTPTASANINATTATRVTVTDKDICSASNTSSDGNQSDYSFANIQSFSNISTNSLPTNETNTPDIHFIEHDSSEIEDVSDCLTPKKSTSFEANNNSITTSSLQNKCGKRIGFIFDSTLAAFLMMGNLSPGLKNHAVTMFEVGKLCDESMITFLSELEKVSLLDAEGEGDVSRYFTHAVILRSTICSLRHVLSGGLDLLRLECLEGLDTQTRDRVLEKKYKFLISSSPLSAKLTHLFKVPFFGQYFRSSDCSHMWTKLFYYQLTGYGPPSLYLSRGTVLKQLPRLFLGYGKLLINILHSDSFVISSENYRCLNDQLQNGCVLVQGYGIRTPGELHYEPFPFNYDDKHLSKWVQHQGVRRLEKFLDLNYNCGYITFLNTGVPDMGSKTYNEPVHCIRHGRRNISMSHSNKKPQQTSMTKITKNIPSNEEFAMNNSKEISLRDNDDIYIEYPTSSATSPLEEEISNFTLINRIDLGSEQSHNTNNDMLEIEDADSLQVELENVHQDHFAISPQKRQNSSARINIQDTSNSLSSNNDKSEDDLLIEDWTLLDVNFGVPLFDVACNTYICEQISKKLCQNDNLCQLTQSSEDMNAAFMNFVKQCLKISDENQLDLNCDLEANLPQPRINLAFENGHVFHWSGK